MKKIKSFFKKHYKRFVVVSITACLCFCFLFNSVFADSYNPGYGNHTIYNCKLIDFSSDNLKFEYPYKNPNAFLWELNEEFWLRNFSVIYTDFTCSDYLQVESMAYSVSIPIAIVLPNGVSASSSNRLKSCLVEFESNGCKASKRIDLTYGNQFNTNCFFAVVHFDLSVASNVSTLFDTFSIKLSNFEGQYDGRIWGIGFYYPITANGKGSASFPNTDIDNATNVENDILNDITDAGSESINTVFSNPLTIIPQGVLHSFMAITSLWKNFLGRTPFSYLFNFSLTLGMFGFVVGMGSIIVGGVSRSINRSKKRSNNRSNNNSNIRRKK